MDVSDNEKLPNNDLPVVIEDDVWCGANVTILKGVTIGHGSIVAAGAVVNRHITVRWFSYFVVVFFILLFGVLNASSFIYASF